MSDRTKDQVLRELGEATTRAGALQYRIRSAENDLKVINSLLDDLNFEYLKFEEQESKDKEKKDVK